MQHSAEADHMTRAEHINWCKKRAREYLSQGDVQNAVASMLSDMSKHPECTVHPAISAIGMMAVLQQDASGAQRFIDGF